MTEHDLQTLEDAFSEIAWLLNEVGHLREEVADLKRIVIRQETHAFVCGINEVYDRDETDRLRARVLELEAAAAMTHGTMGTLEPAPDDFGINHAVPSDTPR